MLGLWFQGAMYHTRQSYVDKSLRVETLIITPPLREYLNRTRTHPSDNEQSNS